MFALELDRRSRQAGWGIVSNAAHPGLRKTNLQLSGPSHGKASPTAVERFYRLSRRFMPFMWQEIDEGILPALYARDRRRRRRRCVLRPARFLELAGGGVTDGQDPRARQKRGRLPQAVGVSEQLTR